jgi:hypothetical protein
MKSAGRDPIHADVLYLLSRVGSVPELPRGVGTGTWGTTRKHVRNDAGTRTPESVVCKFMGQPVGDIRMCWPCRLPRSGVLLQGPRTCALIMTWRGHLGRTHA